MSLKKQVIDALVSEERGRKAERTLRRLDARNSDIGHEIQDLKVQHRRNATMIRALSAQAQQEYAAAREQVSRAGLPIREYDKLSAIISPPGEYADLTRLEDMVDAFLKEHGLSDEE